MLFSIVTICFNARKDIGRTISSVISQNFDDYEYIIIDGGSVDGTCDMVNSLLQKRSNLETTFVSEPDKGISDAFNKGIRLAKGDYVWLVNAGDELMPNVLSNLSLLIQQQKSLSDVIYGNLLWRDLKNGIEYVRKSKKCWKNIYYEMVILHPCTIIRRAVYDSFGMYRLDFKISMDRELLCRLASKGASFCYIDKTLSIMTSGGVSDSQTMREQREYERKIIIELYSLSSRKAKRIEARESFLSKVKTFVKRHVSFLYSLKRKKHEK